MNKIYKNLLQLESMVYTGIVTRNPRKAGIISWELPSTHPCVLDVKRVLEAYGATRDIIDHVVLTSQDAEGYGGKRRHEVYDDRVALQLAMEYLGIFKMNNHRRVGIPKGADTEGGEYVIWDGYYKKVI